MDLVTAIGGVTAVGAVVGPAAWWAANRVYEAFCKLGEHDRRLGAFDEELTEMRATQEQHDERIERTEDGVRNISKLADAINSLGDKMNGQIGHLAEVMGIHNRNNEQRFDDLKDQIAERRTFKPD